MRTFIAVEVGEEARRTLAGVLDLLRSRFPVEVRWSRPENCHVTLRFLGEVAEHLIPEVAAAASQAASGVGPFSLSLGRPARFGGRAPRVLLLDVAGETARLGTMHAALEDELERRGFGRESRRFRPHLTLGRRKKGTIPASWGDVAITGVTEWEVDHIVVFSSTLTPQGPIYTSLARCRLTGEDETAAKPKKEA